MLTLNRNAEKIISKMRTTISWDSIDKTIEDCFNDNVSKENLFSQLSVYVLKKMLCFFIEQNTDQSKKDLFTWLYLKPEIIISSLNKLELSSKDLTSFIDWYISGFVAFFKDNNNLTIYIKEYINFNNIVDDSFKKFRNLVTSSTTLSDTLFAINFDKLDYHLINISELKSEKTTKSLSLVFKSFSSLSYLIEEEKKKNGTFYTEQYKFLEGFGMNQDLLDKLTFENIIRKSQNIVPNLKEKKQKKKTIVAIQLKEQLEKTESEKEENERKRKLLVELKEYYPQNKIIEGEAYKRVLEIINELYNQETISNIKNSILNTNETIREEIRNTTRKELLSVENLNFYEFLTNILNIGDIKYVAYMPLIQTKVCEVENFIDEYISLDDEDKKDLKETYQELINLSLDNLKEYGLNISTELINGEARN